MLDTAILKNLLNHEFYKHNKSKLRRTLFSDDIRSLYSVLCDAHEKYEHDITAKELMMIWSAENPVATRAEKADIEDVVALVELEQEYSDDIAQDLIAKLHNRDFGKRLANLSLEISEGNMDAFRRAQQLIEQHGNQEIEDRFGPDTTLNIHELAFEMDDANRFAFNIETLSRRVRGLQRTEFGIIFATPETGKTAFVVSLAISPGGFVDQGHRVLILGNEESTRRTVVRAYSAATGFTKEEILADKEKAMAIFEARRQGRLSFKDTQDWDLDKIEEYIQFKNADIVFIDQADKVTINGQFNAGHERLRELYRRLRETAKRCNCAIFGVSQASADAEGKTRLNYTMMEGSKIGKAAEADLILGIGRHDSEEDDNIRFITVSKNKISGWHGTEAVTIRPDISRYTE